MARATLAVVGSVDANGFRMTYERAGRGEPVVLVHGYVGDGPSTWQPQLDGLADEFDVIAWDVPGAGGSDDPPESFGMSGFADVLAGFIAALELRSPHLIGLSFGGATLIEFCRRHQNLASTITLVGAYAGWAGSLPEAEVHRRLDQAIELSGLPPADLVDALLPTMFTASASPDITAQFAKSLASFHPVGLRAMARACTEDLTDVLPAIRLPTLLVYGEEDTRAPAGVASELHKAIRDAELVRLPHAGHICNVDAAEAFNSTVRHFLRKHLSR
ncbi:MAG TPA: alpha/beta hydrolase [Acidimicrobiia bacterium]|nr:alpha/beta hydrolase [Acidimicrobiia bacterium]